MLFSVTYLVSVIVNCVSGRAVLNWGTLSAILIVISVIFLMAIGTCAGISADLPPEKLGEIVGRRIGEALIPLLVAVLASRAMEAVREPQ